MLVWNGRPRLFQPSLLAKLARPLARLESIGGGQRPLRPQVVHFGFGVALGFRQADPIARFAITALIIRIGVEATRDAVSRLMDEHDEELAGEILRIVRGVPAVRSVSDLRVR